MENILLFLAALVCFAMGIKSIITREARFSWGSRSDSGCEHRYHTDSRWEEERIVEGFPAILVGLFEIGTGVFILVHREFPW